jgi:hypothetical protein
MAVIQRICHPRTALRGCKPRSAQLSAFVIRSRPAGMSAAASSQRHPTAIRKLLNVLRSTIQAAIAGPAAPSAVSPSQKTLSNPGTRHCPTQREGKRIKASYFSEHQPTPWFFHVVPRKPPYVVISAGSHGVKLRCSTVSLTVTRLRRNPRDGTQ